MLKYYKNTVLYHDDIKNGVGIITGWKKPSLIQEHLTVDAFHKVKTIGTLYTKNGINFVIANLFLNPDISHLILLADSDIDQQMSESIRTFLEFLETEEISFQEKFHYSRDAIHEFCSYFREHVSLVSSHELNDTLEKISSLSPWRASPLELEPLKIETQGTLSSEKQGFMVRANTVKDAWMRSLKLIGTYGCRKLSDYDEEQLELINLSIIVKGEDLENPSMIGELDLTKAELDRYEESLLSRISVSDIKYTYGSRFRDFHGVDQLDYMVDTLNETPYSRRAVAVLWDPVLESENNEGPCLNLYQAIVQDETLYMTAYFRSNDVYNAYPRNIYGILKIQDELCNRLGLKKGYVNTIAGSSHVYERNFQDLQNFLSDSILFCEEDERGYFFVETDVDGIHVSFYNREGVEEREFQGVSASSLRDACCFHTSNMEHAFYLGQEIQKAEIAYQNGLSYTQDKDLVFVKDKKKTTER